MSRMLVYDAKLMRPGCALLQAAMGGTVADLELIFPAESWLTFPTPDMKLYAVDDQQLQLLSDVTALRMKRP